MTIQFVSAFIDLNEDRSKGKSIDVYCKHFLKMASSNIQIYLFLSESYKEPYDRIVGPLENVRIEIIELKDLDTYKNVSMLECKMPHVRTDYKDTKNYMILMNSKIEFIHRVMEKTDYSHYSWIDCSLFHVIHDHVGGINYLKMLSAAHLSESLYIPGCWDKSSIPTFHSISWRFCGGFFIGGRKSLNDFYNEYNSLFTNVVTIHGLAWEVNIWAWLEHIGHLKCIWVKADHNDSIIRLPADAFVGSKDAT